MDFSETHSEKEFKAKVRAVVGSEIVPKVSKWMNNKRLPREMFRSLGKHELLGFRHGAEGIEPIPCMENIHLYKSLAMANGGVAISSFAHSQLGNQGLYFFGDEKQKERFLTPGIRGEKVLAFANTEPGAGSDAASISLTAEDDGDSFLLNGTKTYITNGETADQILVTAVTDPGEEKKHQGISMFIVDGDSTGLKRTPLEKYGWLPSDLTALSFKDVKVNPDRLLGERRRGFYQTMQIFDSSRIGLSALAFGTALGAMKSAHDFASNRKVFGKTLLEFESKRGEMADRAARLQAGWLLIQKAAYHMDSNEEYGYHASTAKLFNTESGLDIANWASILHGASGVLPHNRASQYPLDAKAAVIGEGAPEVQKKIIMKNIGKILDGLV